MQDKPKIVTACWFTELPPEFCRIGISRGTARGQSGFRMFRKLQPGPGTLKLPDRVFTEHYFREVLQPLDAQQIVDELVELAAGRIPRCSASSIRLRTRSGATGDWCRRGCGTSWGW
jgi:hypothetical protein